MPEKEVEYDVDAYIAAYQDIVMSISSYGDDPTISYTHRGIFRNPISMLRKDYPGLAIPLHSFTASVWSEKSPGKKYMCVNPDHNIKMRGLILDNFEEGELITTESSISMCFRDEKAKLERLIEKFVHKFEDMSAWSVEIVIKIEALKKKFPLVISKQT